MSDRRYCDVCDRWVGGGVGHDWEEHDKRVIDKLFEVINSDKDD